MLYSNRTIVDRYKIIFVYLAMLQLTVLKCIAIIEHACNNNISINPCLLPIQNGNIGSPQALVTVQYLTGHYETVSYTHDHYGHVITHGVLHKICLIISFTCYQCPVNDNR